jgi:hypothetical protein
MRHLDKALEQWDDLLGPTQAGYTQTIVVAARKWANLTSDEAVERAAERMMELMDVTEPTAKFVVRSVLRSVSEGTE